MYDTIFIYLIGGLVAGLLITMVMAYPDVKKEYLLRKKALGRE